MEKRWVYLDQASEEIINRLRKDINISEASAILLSQRGIHTYQQAEKFFNPSLDSLHDPFLMKDMSKAVNRLIQAIDKHENILIYGDYDVDGTTSVCLLYDYLQNISSSVYYYINDREEEGYGISKKGIDWANENKIDLIISIDCGIKASEPISYAAELGMDFIICDHHNPGEQLPPAHAILDPKRVDCTYPYKELSGCGVGFKLLQAFEKTSGRDGQLWEYLDLLAVSIAADVVPLTGENRVLCNFGLIQLKSSPRPGLAALMSLSKYPVLSVTDISFGIAPRINAAGRVGHARFAVELLLCKKKSEAKKMAAKIEEDNKVRRDFDTKITEEALLQIKNDEVGQKSSVVSGENWHKGVIGIVASRCIEKYYRPTIVFSQSNGRMTGSARSINGFDIYAAIEKCEDLVHQFGGHKFAAGLSIPTANYQKFKERFENIVASSLREDQLVPELEIATKISFDSISDNFMKLINRMEPFGQDNPSPIFVAENVYVRGGLRTLKNSHLKFIAGQEKQKECLEAIGFGLADHLMNIKSNNNFDIAFQIEWNEYLGNKTKQLRVLDIKYNNDGAKS